ncbi:MAG TPA: diacylglycerol kinase family protein, partial [Gaiellaceae bacterium]|nr:diacylglycerol kinase family protein [Gaiellaceae bacterium]
PRVSGGLSSALVEQILIVNPSATGVTPEIALAVERVLAGAGPLETLLTERPRHAAELAAEACGRCERLYVLSGDGGYNEVVNGVEGEVAVGFLPGGSTSVLPRALGLPRDPVECARVLVGARERRISVGRVNGRRFTFGAGLGLDAELVRRVDLLGRADGRRAGDVAFARALLGIVARRGGRFPAAMSVAGGERVAFALVANCDPYTFVGRVPLHVAPEASFELGLDLVAPRRLQPWLLPHLVPWLVRGVGQTTSRHVLYVHDADEIAIECDAPTPLQADGEDLGDVFEARFEAERDALTVLVGG